MAIDFASYVPIFIFVAFAGFGSMARALFGIYKAYNTYPDFVLEKRRVGIEVLASIFFGIFAVLILREIGLFQFGLNIAALVAGFLGADLVNLITKRLGLSKSMQVVVSRQQMGNVDLNDRQVRALDYVKSKGRITNGIYQKINQISRDAAKRELRHLIKSGRLSKSGKTKSSFYTSAPAKKESGEIRALFGTSKEVARKTHQKAPNQKRLQIKRVSRPNRRVLRVHKQKVAKGVPFQRAQLRPIMPNRLRR